MGLYKDTPTLHLYLRKYLAKQTKTPRPLKPTEYALMKKYQKLAQDVNILITELITINRILRELNIPETHYFIANFNTMTHSLTKQRDLSFFIKDAYAVVKPDEDELAEIKRFLSMVNTRLDYIKTTIIPGNLDFTPIKEYLEVCQRKSIQEDLYAYFGDIQTLIAINKVKDSEVISQYVYHIWRSVESAGKSEDYKARIQEYTKVRTERDLKAKQEEADQAIAKKHMMAEEGMMRFHRAFNNAVERLKTNEAIGINETTLKIKILERGRGNFYVLCCFFSRNRYCFRYLGKGDRIVPNFVGARVFKDEAEATDAMNRMANQHPDKAFSVIDL